MLIWTILFVAVGLLTFTISESSSESYVLLGSIYFLLLYLARLLRILDTPFQPRRLTNDDVDLFLLDDFAAHMAVGASAAPSPNNGDGGIHWDAHQFASDVAAELRKLSEQQPNS